MLPTQKRCASHFSPPRWDEHFSGSCRKAGQNRLWPKARLLPRELPALTAKVTGQSLDSISRILFYVLHGSSCRALISSRGLRPFDPGTSQRLQVLSHCELGLQRRNFAGTQTCVHYLQEALFEDFWPVLSVPSKDLGTHLTKSDLQLGKVIWIICLFDK